jgi:nucleoside-diphosphate-sugar epimerase
VKYLVTGGAGFIGSHLIEALVRRGNTVSVLDNLSTGNLKNLSSIRLSINFKRGEILDRDLINDLVAESDYGELEDQFTRQRNSFRGCR